MTNKRQQSIASKLDGAVAESKTADGTGAVAGVMTGHTAAARIGCHRAPYSMSEIATTWIEFQHRSQ